MIYLKECLGQSKGGYILIEFSNIPYEEIDDTFDEFQNKLCSYGVIKKNYIERLLLYQVDEKKMLDVWYSIIMSKGCLSVNVVYSDVCNLIINDAWSELPAGRIFHKYNSSWEKNKYHIFDVGSSADTTDTISFYCESFQIKDLQLESN